MTDVPTILAAMRDVIAAVDGVNACHYPAPKIINQRREVVLYWGGDADTTISNDLGDLRMWEPIVKAQVLTPLKGNTPSEFAEIDNLLTPIIDAFDTGSTTQVMPSLGGAVHRCQVLRVRPTLLIEYAGHQYYGAELYWSIKFKRKVAGG